MSLLEIDGIHSYYGESHILYDVSLAVEEGETVAILGRNGVGKSTTLKSIMGLVAPKEGRIALRDEWIDGKPPYEIARRGIGFVPEERRVFPDLTVTENMEVVMKAEAAWDWERIYDVFPVLEERGESKALNLSGGEQQMLAIARALVTDPDVLLLDEPTKGLAPVVVDTLHSLLDEIDNQGVTLLLTEQNSNFALDLASRCYILDNGQVKWDGSTSDLRDNEAVLNRHVAVADQNSG